MAAPKRIDISRHNSEGISIEYIKSRDVFYVSAWYDTYVGIEGREISRAEFERELGVPASPPKREAAGGGDSDGD